MDILLLLFAVGFDFELGTVSEGTRRIQVNSRSYLSAARIKPNEVQEQFNALQAKLPELWKEIGRHHPGGSIQEPNTLVIVPSLTVDLELPITKQQAYEERFLFLLFLLRQPHLRLIYLTSQPIDPDIIDYYLDILPGVISSDACRRLFLVTPYDGSPRPLTTKLLERPRLIQHIRSLIPNLDEAHMVPFNTTDLERELAIRLGIPMYAADPTYFAFGTKSGSRRIFAEEGVPYPLGAEDLYDVDNLIRSIAEIKSQKPSVQKVIVKLNEGVSGMGNAIVDLGSVPAPGDTGEFGAIRDALREMQFELESVEYEDYIENLCEGGAIVEELITGKSFRSPSAQMRATPLGEVEMLSTHDQMLGGPTGQTFLGARFPADPEYSWLIMSEALKIGERLAREGIVGRFAVDFVVVQNENDDWEPFAIEVNLRKGGTTAPFLTLQYLTDGEYDAEAGVFRTARGDEKCYVSSDHIESPAYRVFTTVDLFEIASRHRLHFDHTSQTGVVLHMMSGVGGFGMFGVTCIGDTIDEADTLYRRFNTVLDEEAERAVQIELG